MNNNFMRYSHERESYKPYTTSLVTSEKNLADYAKSNVGVRMLFDADKEEKESESGDDLSDREDSWP